MKRITLCVLGLAIGVTALGQTDSIDDINLHEVVVTNRGAQLRIDECKLGAEKIELSTVGKLPKLFGEPDLIKSLTLMAGVHSEGEGGGGFEVRGGNASQNLIMLDGITLYNPSHVMGVFSTFNGDAIGRATLYKGPIPASYGEAISSALDVGLRQGNDEEFHGNATIGLLSAKFMVEGLKDYVIINLPDRRVVTRATIKSMETMLPDEKFMRVNKSYVVNVDKVDSFDTNDVIIGTHEIAIGAIYREAVIKRLL